jgi:hypothetical protein
MPEDPNTGDLTPHPLVERDQWELAFEPFKGQTSAALRLGFNFAMLRKYYDSRLIKSRAVIEALDEAMEVLFPFTDFHSASFDLFERLVDGKLTTQEEDMLHALGMKF